MISPHAIVADTAKIGKNVSIGPYSIIGDNVEIGDDCEIAAHAIINGPTKIGKGNKFFPFSCIGEECQDKKYHGEQTLLLIGDNNTFRENSTVHRGTIQGGGKTVIGNDNLFMVGTHVAHDCIIGNHVIFSNNASVAGHVTVDDYASLGGFVGVHQFCAIGAHSFAAGGTIVFKDIAPYVTVSGYPAATHGLNVVGLERRKFSKEVISALKKAYRIIFRGSNTVAQALEELAPLGQEFKEVNLFSEFLQNSGRGIVR